MELLLGCGFRKEKQLYMQDKQEWTNLVTLDINEQANPDVVHDLEILPLPFAKDTFDEIHAYEVLEHTGKQGDYKFFFKQFDEFWRILKPGGLIFFTCPSWKSMWAWGDPGHTRVINAGSLVFLDKEAVKEQLGKTPITDYSYCYKGDFKRVFIEEDENFLRAILMKV